MVAVPVFALNVVHDCFLVLELLGLWVCSRCFGGLLLAWVLQWYWQIVAACWMFGFFFFAREFYPFHEFYWLCCSVWCGIFLTKLRFPFCIFHFVGKCFIGGLFPLSSIPGCCSVFVLISIMFWHSFCCGTLDCYFGSGTLDYWGSLSNRILVYRHFLCWWGYPEGEVCVLLSLRILFFHIGSWLFYCVPLVVLFIMKKVFFYIWDPYKEVFIKVFFIQK